MVELAIIMQTILNAVTCAALLYGLWRMVAITREARLARAEALEASINASTAATAAAAAAAMASTHAIAATSAINNVADNIEKIEKATNSMKDALVQKEGQLGEIRGRDAEIARHADKKE